MIKDRELKDQLIRHYWAQRCFVQPEVEVYFSGGIAGEEKLVTDVDVLALRPAEDLGFKKILGDCRTLRGQSPIARVLWLRGLIEFVGGRSGIVLLPASARIEPDHRLAAAELGITLLSQADFRVYDRAVLYPLGSESVEAGALDLDALRGLAKRFPRLAPPLRYLYRGFWHEKSFGERIRHVIGQMRSVVRELDPAQELHCSLVADATAAFAVGVAECSAQVFRQYLHPANKQTLSEALKLLIWGGAEQYRFMGSIREKLREAKAEGGGAGGSPLELPAWEDFVQLIRNALESPRVAFEVPWLLRQLAVDVARARPPLQHVASQADRVLLKLGMLAVAYFAKAIGGPVELGDRLVKILEKRQFVVAATPTAGAPVLASPGQAGQVQTAEQLEIPSMGGQGTVGTRGDETGRDET